MKFFSTFFALFLFISCAHSKDKSYTASTPAGSMVRTFLGIPLNDSIDFIRWELKINDREFSLKCNYGIGKPNTNGFYDGGKRIEFKGKNTRENNCHHLQNGNKTLNLFELNDDILHFLNEDKSLMIGNGGWSYALNSLSPVLSDKVNLAAKQNAIKDSIAFEGRTPCGVPGIIGEGKECYKLKWLVILYSNGTYKALGTPWRKEGGKKSTWKNIAGKDGRIIYQLNDENEKPFIHLLKLDDGVLIFTDERGNLLVGNLDFSYTLNRRF